jgi:hypothetical protein
MDQSASQPPLQQPPAGHVPVSGNEQSVQPPQQVQPDPVQQPPVLEPPVVTAPSEPPVPVEEAVENISLKSDIPVPPEAVSGPGKEFGPAKKVEASSDTSANIAQEIIKPSETAPELPKEVKEAGVEVSPSTDQPNIPKATQQTIGLELAKESTPVLTSPTGLVQIPMDEVHAAEIVKTHPVVDSVRWLAVMIIQQIKRAHEKVTSK